MSTDENDALPVAQDLPDADLRRLRRLIDDCVETRGGEVAARTTARTIGATFIQLDVIGRRRFFEVLAVDYGIDDVQVDRAIDAVIRANGPAARRSAEADLRRALQPKRERLLRRLAGVESGLPFLVTLREDLRSHLGQHPELAEVDADLKQILDGWFDAALLRLDRITWDSSATLLERLIEYEAVHAIESWDDLKGRLGPARRCYAFMHPSMPDDPLIFVEVALTDGIAADLATVLDHSSAADSNAPDEADSAIFYSISNCHDGLAGVRLGDFLIKSVVERLSDELPTVRNFATLSPLPGLRRWLQRGLEREEIVLTEREREQLSPDHGEHATAALAGLIDGSLPAADDELLERSRPILLRLAADYLVNQRRPLGPSGRDRADQRSADERRSPDEQQGERALDPVAHFHLSNGAAIERLNWRANLTVAGWERSLGIMVNYRYQLRAIERNYDRYVNRGEATASDAVRKLLAP